MFYKKIKDKINIEEVKKEITSKVNGKEQKVLIYAKFINKEDKEFISIPHLISLYNSNTKEGDYMIFNNKFSELIIGLHINESFEYFKENFNEWYCSSYQFGGITPEEVYEKLDQSVINSTFDIVEFPDYKEQVRNDIEADNIIDTKEIEKYYKDAYEETLWEYEYDNFLVIDGERMADILVKPQYYYGIVDFDGREYNKPSFSLKEENISQEKATANTKLLIDKLFIEIEGLLKSSELEFIELECLVS